MPPDPPLTTTGRVRPTHMGPPMGPGLVTSAMQEGPIASDQLTTHVLPAG
jgi:hypothetical protein